MVRAIVSNIEISLSKSLGEHILKHQDIALKSARKFNLAISGGSLINVLRAAFIEDKTLASKVDWHQWNIFFVDERIVPLDNPDSNFGAFKKAVLDSLPENKRPTVYTIDEQLVKDGKDSYPLIAMEYEKILPEKLDLVILGCGPDGHTCSLFPGESHRYLLDEKAKKVMWCQDSPKPPSDRITVTLPLLGNSNEIFFVAEGSSKQDIMHEIFDKENLELPCALVNHLYGNKVTWFVNDEAVKKVEKDIQSIN
ncbi:6-phosphogluconolactonase SOL3 NDAI_0C03310 [Naumovozyma dairenensis CBS 421]|uniref:6-phosphogluconolactonase-like protein n=1 Tax=Naumovozyma dairenensis (strain ATCC 10597 / BCRC 20456 / CBS 421 / NBRC 0211 / NRRL Y-12639) TaxID=1071378 RepID=G0W880_NAUDC|nr:hypothetical protein NDAI_0C03310 [Naumovozyma dairenensis CBS 421]CCD23991.1 hypothetical protein NDAI_0C03310 [Naumovozyma dairenensis CBS 421]